MTLQKQKNPFKGLYAYEETDGNIFYGRTFETEELFNLIKLNPLTVVSGKSGIGKTSLIQAGLYPKLRAQHFLPIPIRVDYSPGAQPMNKQINEIIQKELLENNISEVVKGSKEKASPINETETLWEYFHRVTHLDGSGNQWIPVLVLDQFEEIFTIGQKHPGVEKLIKEIYYLAENQIPGTLQKRFTEDEVVFPYLHMQAEVRMILVLREDYLPQLNQLKDKNHIKSIDRVLFQVIHLNGKQAREILKNVNGFRTEKKRLGVLHHFYPKGLKRGQKVPDEELEVEPSILSLLCYSMFEKEIKSLPKQTKDEILTEFYDDVLSRLPQSEELAEFIETQLLTENGFRNPSYLDHDHRLKGAVEKAVDLKILRRVIYGQKEYVEIIHDVLTPVIKERKNQRAEKKQRLALKREIQQKRKFNRAVIIACIIAIAFAMAAFIQMRRAERRHIESVSNRLAVEAGLVLAKDNIKAIRLAEAAYKIGMPHPSPSIQQILCAAAYSTLERPFFSTVFQHNDKVTAAALSPGGTRIITASMDGKIYLWNSNGVLLKKFDLQYGRVNRAVYSPGNSNLLITISHNNIVELWDLEKGVKTVFRTQGEIMDDVAFSPDGTLILIRFRNNNTVTLWNLRGEILESFKHSKYISSATFSPDCSKIVTASWDNTAKLWDIKGTLLETLKHPDYVWSAVFSNDNTKIITASSDQLVRIWGVNGEVVSILKNPQRILTALFSPDSKHILVRGKSCAWLRDINGNSLAKYKGSNAVFSPDGKKVISSTDGKIKIWNLKGEPLSILADHSNNHILGPVLSKDGDSLLTWSGSIVNLWNMKRKFAMDIGHLEIFVESNTDAIISTNCNQIFTWSGNTIRLWSLSGDLLIERNNNHKALILDAIFSPDCTQVITASWDNTAMLWNTKDGTPAARLKGHKAQVITAGFMPNSNNILTASWDGSVKVWNRKGKFLHNLYANTIDLKAMETSSSTGKILTLSQHSSIKLWDIAGDLLADFRQGMGDVDHALFSPDGETILTISGKSMKLWDLQGKPLIAFNEIHADDILSASFSDDGTKIVSTSKDDTVKLWDLDGNLLADISETENGVMTASFTPDGDWIITVSQAGVVKKWATPQKIIQWLRTAPIPKLSQKDKENVDIADFEIE